VTPTAASSILAARLGIGVAATATGQTGQQAQAEEFDAPIRADARQLRGAGDQRQERRQPNMCGQHSATRPVHILNE